VNSGDNVGKTTLHTDLISTATGTHYRNISQNRIAYLRIPTYVREFSHRTGISRIFNPNENVTVWRATRCETVKDAEQRTDTQTDRQITRAAAPQRGVPRYSAPCMSCVILINSMVCCSSHTRHPFSLIIIYPSFS